MFVHIFSVLVLSCARTCEGHLFEMAFLISVLRSGQPGPPSSWLPCARRENLGAISDTKTALAVLQLRLSSNGHELGARTAGLLLFNL